MKTVNVSLKQNPYKIYVGQNIMSQLGAKLKALKLGKHAVVITNPLIHRLHGKSVVARLKKQGFVVKVFTVPDSEKSKSAKVAFKLIEDIARYDAMKNVFVIALGGGVIGDLAGYVAAAYKRGIPYVQVPTTLLAQIDSAIGGKVAIDLPIGKNLVGAFYQPKFVLSDVSVLKTLSQRQIRNGLAEAIKYGVIADAKLFQFLENNHAKILQYDLAALQHLVLRSSQIKTKVVLADEYETKSIRTILNYGHTLGHAIEAGGKYTLYHHGEAIALGMRMAADIAVQSKMLPAKAAGRIDDLITAVGLPKKLQKVSTLQILRIMQHDKKFVAGKNRFVLATKIGKVKVVPNIKESVIKKAIKAYR